MLFCMTGAHKREMQYPFFAEHSHYPSNQQGAVMGQKKKNAAVCNEQQCKTQKRSGLGGCYRLKWHVSLQFIFQ